MNFARRAGRVVVGTFAGIGALTVGGVAASQYLRKKKESDAIPSSVVLHLDLNIPLTETKPKPFSVLFDPLAPMKLHSVVKALEHAATDKRVQGVVCTFGSGTVFTKMASYQELRDAVLKFREAQGDEPEGTKRFTWACADTYGEAGDGTLSYYFASAFDKVYVQPSGLVGLLGLHLPNLFYKPLLAKLGIEPQLFQYFEYKNAPNPFTQEGFTKPHREQLERLSKSLFDQIAAGISQGRQLSPDATQTLMNCGNMTAEQAKEAKLIDTILYPDQVLSQVPEGTKVVPMRKYVKELEKDEKPKPLDLKKDDKPKIALITLVGTIARGWDNPNSRDPTICSESAMRNIRAAYEDKTVKAIVVRVDSPGGSAVASDSIRRELERAKQAGLPVVVSMGNFAASGGYYISTAADKIVAQPASITGSIGVIFGKMVIGKALEKVGINHDDVKQGEYASAMSPYRTFTEKEAELAHSLGLRVYEDFTKLVMDSRKLSAEQVDKLARGRVWSGLEAKELQLVDELGGLKEAYLLAGKLAGLEDKALPKLVDFPKPKSALQRIAAALNDEPGDSAVSLFEGSGAADIFQALRMLADVGAVAKRAGLTGEAEGGVRMEVDELGR